MISPTQRTLKALREQGRVCGIVERFNQYAGPFGNRMDLFGFIDIIALDAEEGIIGIQSCGQGFSSHKNKILEECECNATYWLQAGGRIELWGWRKVKVKRGGRAIHWQPRIGRFLLNEEKKLYFESGDM